MVQICKDNALVLAAILLVGISQTFIGMASLVFFQRIIDALPGARQLAELSPALTGYIGLTVLNHILIYLEGYPTSILNQSSALWVRLRAIEKIARIDYLAYQDLGTGSLIQNVENSAEAARGILTGFYLQIVRGILPQMIVSLGFIRYYDTGLFMVILLSYLLLLPVTYYFMRFLRAETEKMLSNQQDFSRFSVRAFMELVVFRINRRFQSEFERVKGLSDEIIRSRAKIYLIQELFASGYALLIFIVEAVVVVQQVEKILAGSSTVGTMVALVAFIRIVFWPVTTFNWAWMTYRLDAVAFGRFQEFFALPNDPGLEQTAQLAISRGEIAFEHVSFAYREQEVLTDFSLTIAGGKTTAFVGPSGSGKSTLMRLLLHLVRPQAGRVLLDGQDLATVNLDGYYQSVAYISQDAPIFDGTLRENLTFHHKVAPERLATVLRQTGLAELVEKQALGLETLVGERGLKLSGGERQRLAFGRLLLQNPRLVILDEPTSALDSLSEDFITRSLADFLAGRTVVIVAHRLQTVRGADEIVVLEAGTAVQKGRFEDLLATPGKFRDLWETQSRETD
jgi:ATP-binding cassette subfamily B protein